MNGYIRSVLFDNLIFFINKVALIGIIFGLGYIFGQHYILKYITTIPDFLMYVISVLFSMIFIVISCSIYIIDDEYVYYAAGYYDSIPFFVMVTYTITNTILMFFVSSLIHNYFYIIIVLAISILGVISFENPRISCPLMLIIGGIWLTSLSLLVQNLFYILLILSLTVIIGITVYRFLNNLSI